MIPPRNQTRRLRKAQAARREPHQPSLQKAGLRRQVLKVLSPNATWDLGHLPTPTSTHSSKVTTPVLASEEAALNVAGTPNSSGQKRSATGTPSVQRIPKARKTSACSCTYSHGTCSKCVSEGLCSKCVEESWASSRVSRSRSSTYTPLESTAAKEKEKVIQRELHK